MRKILLLILLLTFPNLSLGNERFIPIELWLGIPSTGSSELKFYEVNNKPHNGKLKVSGPIDWKNEITGKTIKVYERKTKYGYADVRSTIENINGQKYKDIVLFSYKFDCTNNFYKGKTTWDDDGFVVNTKWSTYERGSAMDMYAKQACN